MLPTGSSGEVHVAAAGAGGARSFREEGHDMGMTWGFLHDLYNFIQGKWENHGKAIGK